MLAVRCWCLQMDLSKKTQKTPAKEIEEGGNLQEGFTPRRHKRHE